MADEGSAAIGQPAEGRATMTVPRPADNARADNKPVAVITGASGDIGRAVARQLAADGYRLLLHYYSSEARAYDLRAELVSQNYAVEVCRADLRTSTGARVLAECKNRVFGPGIGCLVNVAGHSHYGLLQDTSDEIWREVMAANLDSAFYCCRAFLPDFVAEKAGSIVNISSIWGVSGASLEAAYSTAKAGLIGLTKALARELGPSGIRVNCIAPGVIEGRMNEVHDEATLAELASQTALERLGKPEEIASLVSVLVSEKSSYLTGQVLVADGGFLNR